MKIGLLAPSIYMSPTRFGDMIFAPRDLAVWLADGLVERGHDVFFFTAPDVPTKATIVAGDMGLMEDMQEDKLASAGGERMKWASFYTRKRNYELDLTQRAYAMADAGKLDIIHSYHDTLAHFFDELTGFPTVYTLHDPLPNPGTLPYWLLAKFAHHRYVSISDAFRKQGNLLLHFVDTVYHGVPAVSDGVKETARRDYLAFMGRMVPEKGISDAIAVGEQTGIALHIATSDRGENTHSAFYEKDVAPRLSPGKSELVGFMDVNKKNSFLERATAFLFPIHWEEPFGMVMIEAMACGTPVVAYNRGSVPEIVKDGVTGFIVDDDDKNTTNITNKANTTNTTNKDGKWIIKKRGVEGLVEAVKRIGEIDRAACRRHVEENFTVEKMVEGYEKVYQKVLGI
ncbi:MAG: glycosyltransferase family 4 protein [Patescibacteria group bacterium]